MKQPEYKRVAPCAADMLLVTTNPFDYHFCSQGVTKVEGIDDGQELKLTDVSAESVSASSHSPGMSPNL